MADEELRRAAWQVVWGKRIGHIVDPGMAEFIDRLADILETTPGWDPDLDVMLGDIGLSG